MYFILLGRQHQLAQYELRGLSDATKITDQLFVSETEYDFSRLGGAVKRGRVVAQDSLAQELREVQLVGSADGELAKFAKRQCGVRRYKLFDLLHTDLEIVEKGVELVALPDGNVGVVTGYQDIKRYETIDVSKPVRGMEIGMMPAKLTQMLINIGVGALDGNDAKELTIYDPFCGFGTTLFVANSLGYHAIGSDINPALAQQNIKWWPTTAYATDRKMTLFKHDATTVSDKPFLQYVDLIVTEGRLGPVVYENTHRDALQQHMKEILAVYSGFIAAVQQTVRVPIVMTVPSYSRLPDRSTTQTIHHLSQVAQTEIRHIGTYQRAGQLIQREVILL